MKEEKFISLKEAAQISGYTPDYVGQLIRAGKINGKQVYCNVAWMTTADAVLNYKQRSEQQKGSKANIKSALENRGRKIFMELKVILLFFKTFKFALPILILLFLSFLLLNFYLFFYFSNKDIFQGGINFNNTHTTEEDLSY